MLICWKYTSFNKTFRYGTNSTYRKSRALRNTKSAKVDGLFIFSSFSNFNPASNLVLVITCQKNICTYINPMETPRFFIDDGDEHATNTKKIFNNHSHVCLVQCSIMTLCYQWSLLNYAPSEFFFGPLHTTVDACVGG